MAVVYIVPYLLCFCKKKIIIITGFQQLKTGHVFRKQHYSSSLRVASSFSLFAPENSPHLLALLKKLEGWHAFDFTICSNILAVIHIYFKKQHAGIFFREGMKEWLD